jgi:hypothetical protein
MAPCGFSVFPQTLIAATTKVLVSIQSVYPTKPVLETRILDYQIGTFFLETGFWFCKPESLRFTLETRK